MRIEKSYAGRAHVKRKEGTSKGFWRVMARPIVPEAGRTCRGKVVWRSSTVPLLAGRSSRSWSTRATSAGRLAWNWFTRSAQHATYSGHWFIPLEHLAILLLSPNRSSGQPAVRLRRSDRMSCARW